MEYVNEDYLNITERLLYDESVERYKYKEYQPQSQSNNDNPGEILIDISNQDMFSLPCESYLHFEGRLQPDADGNYAIADKIALINNAMAYLFTSMRLQISEKNIEQLYHPGHASSMLGYLKYPDDFTASSGLNMGWQKDTSTRADDNKYSFSAANVVSGDYVG